MTSKNPHSPTLLAAAALLAAPLTAQLANDECANATVLRLGINPSINAVGATQSPVTWAGGTPQDDVWLRYRADYRGTVEINLCDSSFILGAEVFTGTCGSLQPLSAGSSYCGPYYGNFSPTWFATAGTDYYIRVYKQPFAPSAGPFSPFVTCDPGVRMVGVAEVTPRTGTLGSFGGEFQAMDRLRWTFAGSLSQFIGNFGATAVNIGNGGSAPVGFTPTIPGLRQLWSGSTPSGTEFIFGPYLVGGFEESVLIPAGLFALGDTVRIQGLILDGTATSSALPVVPSLNTIEWVYGQSCQQSEGFEGVPPGFGSLPTGWTELLGPWVTTQASNAPQGSQYLRCDTFAGVGGQSPVDYLLVSPVYPAAGLSTLEFLLGRLGPNTQALTVLYGDGSSTPVVTLATFDRMAPGGQAWTQQRIPLPNLFGGTVQFAFRYRSRGSEGDIAIDGLCLR